MHEHRVDSTNDEGATLLSTSAEMKKFNYSGLSLGVARPGAGTLSLKNTRSLNTLIIHLSLLVTLNTSALSQQYPSCYYSAPNTELFMCFAEDGTETSVLVDPHLPNVHYVGLKRAFDINVRSIKQFLLAQMSPSH